MADEIKRLPGSLNPTPEEILFKEGFLNHKFPGALKWHFVMVDPDTIFERSDAPPSDEGPMWIFKRK